MCLVVVGRGRIDALEAALFGLLTPNLLRMAQIMVVASWLGVRSGLVMGSLAWALRWLAVR